MYCIYKLQTHHSARHITQYIKRTSILFSILMCTCKYYIGTYFLYCRFLYLRVIVRLFILYLIANNNNLYRYRGDRQYGFILIILFKSRGVVYII